MTIIVTSAILHNMLRIHNDPMPQDDDANLEIFQEIPVLPTRQIGNTFQTNLINTAFRCNG